MLSHALLAISLALAIALLAIGLRMHMPDIAAPPVNAAECCWAPKGRDTRCFPCRPTRETR
jgi:hypothetical protein